MVDRSQNATDSPWVWLIVFLCGGLVIVTLAAPQINRRQRRLDLQFARQEAGQTVWHDTDDPQADTRPGNQETLVPVRPLIVLLALALAVVTVAYWFVRWGPSLWPGEGGAKPEQRADDGG